MTLKLSRLHDHKQIFSVDFWTYLHVVTTAWSFSTLRHFNELHLNVCSIRDGGTMPPHGLRRCYWPICAAKLNSCEAKLSEIIYDIATRCKTIVVQIRLGGKYLYFLSFPFLKCHPDGITLSIVRNIVNLVY